jgi:hypothetical protein
MPRCGENKGRVPHQGRERERQWTCRPRLPLRPPWHRRRDPPPPSSSNFPWVQPPCSRRLLRRQRPSCRRRWGAFSTGKCAGGSGVPFPEKFPQKKRVPLTARMRSAVFFSPWTRETLSSPVRTGWRGASASASTGWRSYRLPATGVPQPAASVRATLCG